MINVLRQPPASEMGLPVRRALGLLVAVLLFCSQGDALLLQCYDCTSEDHLGCKDPFNATDSLMLCGRQHDACLKTVATSTRIGNDGTRHEDARVITRMCATVPRSGWAKQNECHKTEASNGGYVENCFCGIDECNGARKLDINLTGFLLTCVTLVCMVLCGTAI